MGNPHGTSNGRLIGPRGNFFGVIEEMPKLAVRMKISGRKTDRSPRQRAERLTDGQRGGRGKATLRRMASGTARAQWLRGSTQDNGHNRGHSDKEKGPIISDRPSLTALFSMVRRGGLVLSQPTENK